MLRSMAELHAAIHVVKQGCVVETAGDWSSDESHEVLPKAIAELPVKGMTAFDQVETRRRHSPLLEFRNWRENA